MNKRFEIWLTFTFAPLVFAQAPSSPRPFTGFSTPAPNAAPAREVPLVEKRWEALANQDVGGDGTKALSIAPEKWKHAETENFILHFRRVTEAQKVAREVEYDLWYVANALGATKDRYARKSHVFVFENEGEWLRFKGMLGPDSQSWSASFAKGDELFLNVRGGGNSGAGTSFDSSTLAHETTHAVVARLYKRKRRWPLWLNEGFAEYMGGASVAARKGQPAKHYQRTLGRAEMPLSALENMKEYPTELAAIHELYQTSEKFVRFLMNDFPKNRIVKFIDAILDGKDIESSVIEVYGDKVKDWAAFMKRYERFNK